MQMLTIISVTIIRFYQQYVVICDRVRIKLGIANIQGCIKCAILPFRMGARGVTSEHMENIEMFSCFPT